MRSLPFIALFITSLASAFACRCGEAPSVREATREADAVFVGRVMKLSVSYRKLEGRDGLREVIECEFLVSDALKGIAHEKKRTSVITNSTGPACGFSFRIGDEYLVYARSEGKELETNVCTRTRPRFIIDEKQDFSDISKIKGDDAMESEVPLIREALKKK